MKPINPSYFFPLKKIRDDVWSHKNSAKLSAWPFLSLYSCLVDQKDSASILFGVSCSLTH